MFTAEAHAIDQAFDIISMSKHKKFIIFSDSLSVLLSLRNKRFKNPLIIKLLWRWVSMSNSEQIIICWIPSHIGVRENERAGSAAKSALELTPTNSGFYILTWYPQSINSFTQNGSNDVKKNPSTINSFKSSPRWENGDHLWENQDENKSLYHDCALVI